MFNLNSKGISKQDKDLIVNKAKAKTSLDLYRCWLIKSIAKLSRLVVLVLFLKNFKMNLHGF